VPEAGGGIEVDGRAADGRQVAIEVRRIASGPGRPDQRAEALLEALSRLVPFRAAWISVLDPERREQPPLVSHGYPDGLNEYMAGPAGVAEIELLGLSRSGATLLSDLPLPLEEVRSWAEYLAPAGFRGGLAAGLFTADGRYVGMLGLNTDTTTYPTRAARDLVDELASTIAHAIDPMRAISAAAQIVRDARAGIVLTRAGNTLPLDGVPAHPLLSPGSALLSVAAGHLAAGVEFTTFLCPYSASDAHGHVRATVLGCPHRPLIHLTGVVLLSPPGNLRGLNRAELEILGLLVEDWPDRRIAAALDLPETTVVHTVEHILTKLDAANRDVALMRAVRLGLYIPRPLNPACA
jgi:DNA-binding CsgD family transcriptional regulator